MKVVFCSTEVVPFAKTGGLADVCGALPVALKALGLEVLVVMPKFKSVENAGYDLQAVTQNFSYCKTESGIDVYFIEHEDFFGRDALYGDEHGDYSDNLARFRFYCIQVFELLKQLAFPADIIHCHDWHAALIPVYLKEYFKDESLFANTRTVLTIHNLAFQGLFSKDKFSELELRGELLSDQAFLFYDQVNLLRAGIKYCDEVTTVSPRYATEIQTTEYGCGLEEVLRDRGVTGILNGLDYDYWNPATDTYLSKTYTNETRIEGKLENKIDLLKRVGLSIDIDRPLFGFVGRISHQKGMDLIINAIQELEDDSMQLVIQGLGDKRYQDELNRLADTSNQIATVFDYDERLAHMIYAGSDWFLMPSQFEPCGLTQMISMKYGTPPIVYRTGGLADTVQNFDAEEHTGNGLMFQVNETDPFVRTIREAINLFDNKKDFLKLMLNAMTSEFQWMDSARQYDKLYQCLQSD